MRILLIILIPLTIASLLFSCQSSGSGSKIPDKSIIEAEKPVVDSSKIIEIGELYRAKRYEDLQSGIMDGPENVRKMTFHGQKMGSLSPEIARFTYLATLDVVDNELSTLPAELASLHYLQGFYANSNRLTEFPAQLFLLPLLDRLNLSDNQISSIPPEIMKMDQLSSLNLGRNLITSVPVELYELKNLRALNLEYNGLTRIPVGLNGLESLRKLDLSHNQLTRIPDDILSMREHLEELSLQGNQIPIEEVKQLIEDMPSTKVRY